MGGRTESRMQGKDSVLAARCREGLFERGQSLEVTRLGGKLIANLGDPPEGVSAHRLGKMVGILDQADTAGGAHDNFYFTGRRADQEQSGFFFQDI